MLTTMRNVWPLFLAVALLMAGNGLQGSLLGLRAKIEGFDIGQTGIVMSSYYGGFLLSSIVTIRLIRQVGHIRVFAAFASLASTTVLLHAVLPLPSVWLFLRFVTGFSLAGLYVVAESWLNHASTNTTRGSVLSIYMVIIYGCMAAGQLILIISDPASIMPFIVVSILVSIALVPVSLHKTHAPEIEMPKTVPLAKLYAISPLGFTTCLAAGMAQGAFLSLGAVYASDVGMSTVQIGILMSVALIAVVPVQLPLGWLSDRFDRRWVITGVSALVAFTAAVAAGIGGSSFSTMLVLFALYGGFSSPLYSLALAHTNDYLEADEMLGASSKLVFVNGMGSVAGPLVVSLMMMLGGNIAFFGIAALIHLVLASFAIWRMTRREAVSEEDRGEYVHVAIRATSVATVSAVEEAEESAQTEDG